MCGWVAVWLLIGFRGLGVALLGPLTPVPLKLEVPARLQEGGEV